MLLAMEVSGFKKRNYMVVSAKRKLKKRKTSHIIRTRTFNLKLGKLFHYL